ncbi:ferredoxin--NADP reductase [Shewanella litorisediminis]|uniref:ferredoxin--NADP(+) reductase n=1 Tax=Shewanella litorisediminis TaxID=1173586 RepID=A0ABX7G541_9GAMM|nr:ferredoxin--NADP reductase [Shewanella litorisediminis]MCL2917992.1 ferredoxin--NADP reductase [Shewanella litorisediminis]QRH02425.1 ferredoxin--NADP reductase [Shewanella litorisediminis]
MWVEGRVLQRRDWTDKLFSLKIDAKIAPFIAGQFIKLSLPSEDKRIARAYSLVNPPGTDYIEVLAVAVEEGELSPRLQDLSPGDVLQVSASATGFLTLSELPDSPVEGRQLWMLATGTAVGPFISMLGTAEPWERFEHLVLVYGVRRAEDLAYLDELQALAASRPRLQLILSVTRETVPGALHKRIPDALASGELEAVSGLTLSAEHSQVMICGNPEMVAGTQALLLERGLCKNLRRTPGQITVEKYW